ncbi:hypothetical protein EW026_g2520 [Hermanssonia centrifuga]|uniref:Amidohydrolase 3 domain-containing protein n=1 Tax=Hermanssonia centrifuga TaxID=98765 RepID=A0A4S4KSQ2_9APHY|nr:hypothetical protein EW026_g2520 [Hermanssonia centrifuga]
MNKGLPTTSLMDPPTSKPTRNAGRVGRLPLPVVAVFAFLLLQSVFEIRVARDDAVKLPLHASEIIDKCRALSIKPGPPEDFHLRTHSDRFVAGTKPTLIKNATIWTGGVGGLEILKGDILVTNGLIKGVGVIDKDYLAALDDVVTIDASGAWVSPGIVDLHSHLGVSPSPSLSGSNDGNSRKGPILPWLRALDSLNTHNDAYRLSVAGGVTTALVLPGSANAIGGQGIVIKLRPPEDRSPTGMLLENPYSTNQTEYDTSAVFRYRQMKHACGENPNRVYSDTRMDVIWAFRQAYDKARQIKNTQDQYCTKALAGEWKGLAPDFPEDLQWEALVDVLRGRVKVHTHCYETVDLDDLVRITNEFKFSIAAFHHAHETYLVPDTLKAAYGHPPAIALFASNARYKRESYRGSEFAPRVLADNGLQVVMKSDHPVLDSRFLLYEAQQAHYYGLDGNLALLSVTGTPAQVMGEDHRIGFIKAGYDADLVLWDSHPLALGATPQQVWIDGIPQLSSPHVHRKPASSQASPQTPDFDKEASDAVKFDGLPPLGPKTSNDDFVVFTNVSRVLTMDTKGIEDIFVAGGELGVALVHNGKLFVDLAGGWISPGLISFGSVLGLEEIQGEASTSDGYVLDPLLYKVPDIAGGDNSIIRAADGLQYTTRNALLAYMSGITAAITAPKAAGFLAGLSVVFATSAKHQLDDGGLIQDVAAVHVFIHHVFIGQGEIPLVIDVDNADIMASLLRLKGEIEEELDTSLKFVFSGASEAHLLAKEISDAGVGVVVSPSRSYPGSWENRRILPGPPLSEKSNLLELRAHNVSVALGVPSAWEARNTRFDLGWIALEAGESMSKKEVLALASVNLQQLLGVHSFETDLVASKGGDLLDFDSKVVAVISPRRGIVDLF